MSSCDLIQLLIFAAVFTALTPLLCSYVVRVFSGSVMIRPLRALEQFCYRISDVNPDEEMGCWSYTKALLLFNLYGLIFVLCVLLTQRFLPLNPQGLSGTSWPLAFNIAISYVTNTNWQSYAGEITLSYFTQMVALTSQNFLSAATGMCVFLAFIRGLTRANETSLGNFHKDLVRTVVYIFLPLAIILAIVLASQGVVQTFSAYVDVETVEHAKQTIPLGPVASQVAIKQLGSNGGGFFNANSAHPFENPTMITNFLETLCIILIPAALVYAYGVMVGSKKHGWLLFFVMFLLWGSGVALSQYAEQKHNPILKVYPNMEGKESRFGTAQSVLWAITTTATSNGSVNSTQESLSPLTGGVALFNIMLGEIEFGGVGVGMCSMIMFTLLTVFLSGLMVGRTPEYLGKKIETKEVQLVTISVLSPGALILIGAGLSTIIPNALSCLANHGPHGLSEILYAFSSASGNNGSAFAGLNANTTYYNLFLGLIMLMGRLAVILPSLAVAGLLVRKKVTPASVGTFSTDTMLFVTLLLGVILIVGALTFFPALSLGPIVEHFLMIEGRTF
jgi:potassium-transporting ATPase potassium-binding subunit